MQKHSLVIIACGSSSRLIDIHQNQYPKILCNSGNQLFIEELIDAYTSTDQIKDITLLVSSVEDKNKIFDAYVNVTTNQLGQQMKVEVFPQRIGTARTIKWCVDNKKIPTKNVIVAWSDIYPKNAQFVDDNIGVMSNLMGTIYVDSNSCHRVDYTNFSLSKKTDMTGNVAGLFKFNDLSDLFNHTTLDLSSDPKHEIDITDVMSNVMTHKFAIFASQEFRFVDIGDMQKYEKHINEKDITCRFFNDIEFKGGMVIKRAKNKMGLSVINNEIRYYQQLREHLDDPDLRKVGFPNLLTASINKGEFKMSKIDAITVNDYIESLPEIEDADLQQIWSLFNTAIQKLHNIHSATIDADVFEKELRYEYYDVILERLSKMQNLLPHNLIFGSKLYNISDTLNTVRFCVETIVNETVPVMRTIHGDPNSSNTMVSATGDVSFIDPRGKFGTKSGILGHTMYDYAKFLYGITGYDKFNLTLDYRLTYDSTKCEYTIQTDVESIIDKLDALTTNVKIKFLVGVIWLKLPLYTINNLNKSIASYIIGQHLIRHYSFQLLNS